MSDQQVKEFFSSVLEGGPADHLDLDRAVAAGRRRRRLRTATTLASAAAVLVVVGALVVSVLPDDGRADLGGRTTSAAATPTESPTIGPDVVVPGTAADWALALEPYLPAGTQTPAVVSDASQSLGIVRAVFRYVADGRPTALVITAYAPGDRSYEQVYNALQESCSIAGTTCEKTVEATSGPVLVRRSDDGTKVFVSSVRGNGAVVTVDSWNGDTDADLVLPGSGAPGFSTDEQVLELAAFAATVPLPASVLPTPTPTPGPSTDAPTAEASPSDSVSTGPEPIPTGTAPTPEPTPTPTRVPKPAGLVGAVARSACDRVVTFEAPAPRPITGDVLQYVLCPLIVGGQTLQEGTFTIRPGDAAFRTLDDALRLPEVARGDGICGANAIVVRPVFVSTADGWFKVAVPTDGCAHPQQAVLDALAAAVPG